MNSGLPWLAVVVSLLGGCATAQPTLLPALPTDDRPVLIVADGAGDYRACSESMRETATADRHPFDVVTYVWSHGYLRNAVDQTDWGYAVERGDQLAKMVTAYQAKHPAAPVVLVGHSAGSAVVLSAAEDMAPDQIDRILLLAPSVSEGYDLRPALRACRSGIDVYVSEDDWVWLGLLVRLLGTTDKPLEPRAAGRFGFTPTGQSSDDAHLFDRLRVHPWRPELAADGHNGGHFGSYQPEFLRRHVFPGLFPSDARLAPPG